MEDMVKTLKLEIKTNTSSLDELNKKFTNSALGKALTDTDSRVLNTKLSTFKIMTSTLDTLKKKMQDAIQVNEIDIANKLQIQIDELTKELNKFTNKQKDTSSKFGKLSSIKSNIDTRIATSITNISSLLKDKWLDVVDFVKDSFKQAFESLQEASAYSANSILYNSGITQNKLQYGFTDSQAYAFNKANDFTGVQSIDDFALMTKSQKEFYSEMFDRYLTQYENWMESGFLESYQKFQVDFKIFKEDFIFKVADFFVNNKDTIEYAMDSLIEVLPPILTVTTEILKILSVITKLFTPSSGLTTSSTSDILNSMTTNNNVTYNYTSNSDFSYSSANKDNVVNAYKQHELQTLYKFYSLGR